MHRSDPGPGQRDDLLAAVIRHWAAEGATCGRTCYPHFMAYEKTCPKPILCSSDDDGPADDGVVGDDHAPHPDDGPGHMRGGRISAHGSREGGGHANVDAGTRERAKPGCGAGAFCQPHAGEREAAPPEGIDNGKLRGALANVLILCSAHAMRVSGRGTPPRRPAWQGSRIPLPGRKPYWPHRPLKRGVFHSLVDLQAAIKRFLAEANDNPRPFRWTKDPDKIIAAVRLGAHWPRMD